MDAGTRVGISMATTVRTTGWGRLVAVVALTAAAVLASAVPAAADPTSVVIDAPSVIVPSPATPFSATITLGDEAVQDPPSEIYLTVQGANPSTGAVTFANATGTGPLGSCTAQNPAVPRCIWPNAQPSQSGTMTVDLVPNSFASGTFTITVWSVTPLTTTALATWNVTIGTAAGNVQIDLFASSDTSQRPQNAQVDWACTSGASGSVVVPPGGSTGSASAFIPAGQDCQASVTTTGSAPGVDVLQNAAVAVGSAAPTTYDPSRDVEIIRPGTTTAFTFTLTSVSQGVGEEASDPVTRAPVRVLPATG